MFSKILVQLETPVHNWYSYISLSQQLLSCFVWRQTTLIFNDCNHQRPYSLELTTLSFFVPAYLFWSVRRLILLTTWWQRVKTWRSFAAHKKVDSNKLACFAINPHSLTRYSKIKTKKDNPNRKRLRFWISASSFQTVFWSDQHFSVCIPNTGLLKRFFATEHQIF